jgi:hypothetical protein
MNSIVKTHALINHQAMNKVLYYILLLHQNVYYKVFIFYFHCFFVYFFKCEILPLLDFAMFPSMISTCCFHILLHFFVCIYIVTWLVCYQIDCGKFDLFHYSQCLLL